MAFARRALPLWTERGFPDQACTIHSAGVTFWTILGFHLGHSALAEFPAPRLGAYGHVGDDVRCDATWFDSRSDEPILLVEFERYDGISDEQKLAGKVDNLLLAYHRRGDTARAVVLAYWTKGLVNLPSHEVLRRRLRDGFETMAKEVVAGVSGLEIHFYQFVLREVAQEQWQLWQVIDRGTA